MIIGVIVVIVNLTETKGLLMALMDSLEEAEKYLNEIGGLLPHWVVDGLLRLAGWLTYIQMSWSHEYKYAYSLAYFKILHSNNNNNNTNIHKYIINILMCINVINS